MVGRDCHIGRGARVSGSYLLDGVVVHAGAQVSDALLCDGAVVHAHAVLHPGVVLSYKVVLLRLSSFMVLWRAGHWPCCPGKALPRQPMRFAGV